MRYLRSHASEEQMGDAESLQDLTQLSVTEGTLSRLMDDDLT